MSISERSSTVLDARFLTLNNTEPLAGFPLGAPDGSVAAPSYSFERNSGTGLSLVSDNLVFGVNGVSSVVVGMEANVAFGAPPADYGATTSGEGVLFLNEATSTPSGGSGSILYVSGSDLILDNGSRIVLSAKGGDVFGPASSTLNAVASFDGVTGKLIQDTFLLATDTTLLAADASAAFNSYAFSADSDTGLNLNAGVFSLAAGGADRLHILPTSVQVQETTTNVWAPDGSVGAPAYSFSSAPTSGVFLSGTDVNLATAGVTGMVVENVGGAVPNVALAGSAPSDYGAGTPGVGVVFVPEASVVPSGSPNLGSGSILYASSDELYILRADGDALDLTKCAEETSGTTTLNAVVRYSGATGKIIQDTTTLTVDASGQWAGPDGALSAVTYGFASDPNTGLYSEGANVMNLVTAGASRLRVAAASVSFTGVMRGPSGSESAPNYTFTSLPTSGLYYDALVDALCVASDSTCVMAALASPNLSLCGPAAEAGGGADTLLVHEVTTAPSTNPTDGVFLYVSGDELLMRTPSGTLFTLTDQVTGPGSATDEALVLFSGTTGKVVQNSLVTGSDAGKLSSGDGLVSAPAYSFTSDPDSGMYISGTDVYLSVGGGVGGVGQLKVDGSAVSAGVQLQVPSGTAALPSLIFTGDPDTGLFLGSSQVSVSTGGKSGLRLGTAGNVSLTGSSSFGAGENVVYMEEVGVVPAGTLASGGLLYITGTDLVFHDDAGTATTVNDSTAAVGGPTSSTVNGVAYWNGTSGDTVAGASVLATATQMSATEYRVAVGTGITNDTSRLDFTSGAGSLLVGSGGVEVTHPLHADTQLRTGGATGLSETVSGTTLTSNHLNAAGTFEWRRNGATIFQTSALNLTTANSYVFPSGTETLEIGNTAATTYTIASTSSGTTDDVVLAVGGAERVSFTDADPYVGDAVVSTGRLGSGSIDVFAPNGSIAAPAYTFFDSLGSGMYYDAATTSLGFSVNSKLAVTFADAGTIGNMAICTASPPSSYNGGEGVVYIGEAVTEPTVSDADYAVGYVTSEDDLKLSVDATDAASNCTLNAAARRAQVTLSSYTVADDTSDDLDGETWTDVDSAGVSGTTTGALSIPSTETTVMVIAHATWVANNFGYRRISITSGAGHTVEATSAQRSTGSSDTTAHTVTLVRRLSSSEANLQFAAQVYQNSGGNLDVDVTMTLLRMN